MRKHKVGDRVLVTLSGGRIVEATIKAIIATTDGVKRSAQGSGICHGPCSHSFDIRK